MQRTLIFKFQIGDYVLVRQQKKNKLSTSFGKTPYSVTEIKGTMITATSEDSGNITRNVSVFKQIPIPNLEPQDQIIEDFHGDMQGRIQTDANDANASVKIEKSCCLK